MKAVKSPKNMAAALANLWAPAVVCENETTIIKVAKIKGELGWHTHDDEDKIFSVLKGVLKIQMEHESVELKEGEMYVIPKGVRNNPSAEDECHIMFIEPK